MQFNFYYQIFYEVLNMRRFAWILLILTLNLTDVLPVFSGTTGKIAGRITDAGTDEGLPGTNVQIEGTALGAAADINGDFVILNVPPGFYTLKISFIGYQTVLVKDIRVNVDFTTRVEQPLTQSAVEMAAIEIYGERNPLVRQDLTNTLVAVTAETIEQLPVDQIRDVISLQAGVTQDNSGALHIRGGRSNEIAYHINGISINNPFSNLQGVGLATNAIEEVSVSAGTFSAEYGNALSGVINFVTKDGGPDYHGSLKFWTGGNFSTHDDVFFNIDDIDVFNNRRMEWTFGGPVPVLGKNVTFFISGVRQDDNGHLFGVRVYDPEEILFIAEDSFIIDPFGDSGERFQADGDREVVPMVTRENLNLTTKLSWQPFTKFKITYDLVLDDGERFPRSSFRRFRFNPDGRAKSYSNATNQSIGITHTLSNKTFYTLKMGLGLTHSRSYAFKDPLDPGYVASFGSLLTNNIIPPTDTYLAGGTDLARSSSKTRSQIVKIDVVSQVHPAHEFKFGAEFQHHRLERDSFTLLYDIIQRADFGGSGPIIPRVEDNPEFTSPQSYVRNPIQGAVYFLDKIELARSFILNIGARYEYLATRTVYNPDLSGTVDDGVAKAENLADAKPKHRLAPRISLSFPITESGVIRFSYGHFYQYPPFTQIYQNPRFEDFDFNQVPTFGNANLEPQRSIQYEMGLQQQLSDNFKADLTIFYKDVSNLTQTRRVYAGEVAATKDFNVITNISYANVKGFTFALLKRKSPGSIFSATLDYTYGVAEGAFDDALKLAFDTRSGRDTEQEFVPLDHDRAHTINATMTLSKTNNWSFSTIGSIWTGTPYTPSLPTSVQDVQFAENSARRPLNTNVDLKIEKYFKAGRYKFSVFMQIENAFDTLTERFVHTNTGRSLTSLAESTNPNLFNNLRHRINADADNLFPIQFLDDFYQREDWLAPPREIRWGMTFNF